MEKSPTGLDHFLKYLPVSFFNSIFSFIFREEETANMGVGHGGTE